MWSWLVVYFFDVVLEWFEPKAPRRQVVGSSEDKATLACRLSACNKVLEFPLYAHGDLERGDLQALYCWGL
jgi:hypothetical protein